MLASYPHSLSPSRHSIMDTVLLKAKFNQGPNAFMEICTQNSNHWKMAADCYRNPRRLGLQLVFDSSLVLLLDGATVADVPTGTSRSGCLFPLSCYYVSGKRRDRARQVGHVLIFRVSHKGCLHPPPPPNLSIPSLFWFMSCSHYLFSGLSSWGPGATTRSWIFGAGQPALTCRKHALALTRLVPLPPSLSPRMDCQSGSKTENCWNI